MVSLSKLCQHTGILNELGSLRIVIEIAVGIYRLRHITTPPETRPELKTVQHERGGKNSHARRSRIRFCFVRQHSRKHASRLASFRGSPGDHPLAATPVSDNDYSGSTIGERRSESIGGKNNKPFQALTEWIVQYQGSIWEILPVAHEGVPLSRDAFITAISFCSGGYRRYHPPLETSQPKPDQLQLQKSLNSSAECKGSRSHARYSTTARSRKTR